MSNPTADSKITDILNFGYDDPTFINDIHALVGKGKVAEAATQLQQLMILERIDEWEQMHKDYPTAPYIPDFIWKDRLADLQDQLNKEVQNNG